ncbi:glycohydrolase toxin TNT-related protein [Microbacterium luticocti]|uniref:glycohydrolase toxin TNT-related protein n=1 Tax=Microbacterium luticocti TaxID=451764 RepID=UPI00048C4A27|nr:glycohydrolase toxin TNT-related protein [Microbacterium luticocti]
MTRFWVDESGRQLPREPVPAGAEVWDLYGSLRTRYVYLVENGTPAAYETRSLPWQENPAAYHQILVTGDCRRIHDAYVRSTDTALRRDLEDLVEIGYYVWDSPIFAGPVAPAFGDPGGATGLTLPLPLEFYLRLGLVRELDLGRAS